LIRFWHDRHQHDGDCVYVGIPHPVLKEEMLVIHRFQECLPFRQSPKVNGSNVKVVVWLCALVG
jgi:hypothetical protein